MPPVEIQHFSCYLGGNASEFIQPKGIINITSHGLGSGIYGVTSGYLANNRAISTNPATEQYTFVIQNPYVLDSNQKCDVYIKSSKFLLNELDFKLRIAPEKKINITDIAVKFIDQFDISRDLTDTVVFALEKFQYDYNHMSDYVAMPIVYILKELGYDGIVGINSVCDSWNKGNIKFINYPTMSKGDTTQVKFIFVRKGVDISNFMLKQYARNPSTGLFHFEESRVIKEQRRCPKCDSMAHKFIFCPKRREI